MRRSVYYEQQDKFAMVASTDINELIRIGESLTLEYKSSFDRKSIETLVAFANANGGTVLVGVEDNGTVLGVSLGKETLNKWLGQVKSSTSPSIIPDIEAFDISSRTVVAINISEYPINTINTRCKYFKRIAHSNPQPV